MSVVCNIKYREVDSITLLEIPLQLLFEKRLIKNKRTPTYYNYLHSSCYTHNNIIGVNLTHGLAKSKIDRLIKGYRSRAA